MTYTPRTVLAGGLTGLPSFLPKQRKPLRRPYKVYERSTTAQKVMAYVCAHPGELSAVVDRTIGFKNTYLYLATLRMDQYIDTTTERGTNNILVTRVWPSKIYLAKYPPTL